MVGSVRAGRARAGLHPSARDAAGACARLVGRCGARPAGNPLVAPHWVRPLPERAGGCPRPPWGPAFQNRTRRLRPRARVDGRAARGREGGGRDASIRAPCPRPVHPSPPAPVRGCKGGGRGRAPPRRVLSRALPPSTPLPRPPTPQLGARCRLRLRPQVLPLRQRRDLAGPRRLRHGLGGVRGAARPLEGARPGLAPPAGRAAPALRLHQPNHPNSSPRLQGPLYRRPVAAGGPGGPGGGRALVRVFARRAHHQGRPVARRPLPRPRGARHAAPGWPPRPRQRADRRQGTHTVGAASWPKGRGPGVHPAACGRPSPFVTTPNPSSLTCTPGRDVSRRRGVPGL